MEPKMWSSGLFLDSGQGGECLGMNSLLHQERWEHWCSWFMWARNLIASKRQWQQPLKLHPLTCAIIKIWKAQFLFYLLLVWPHAEHQCLMLLYDFNGTISQWKISIYLLSVAGSPQVFFASPHPTLHPHSRQHVNLKTDTFVKVFILKGNFKE